MAATHSVPGSDDTSGQVLHVWCPGIAGQKILSQFHEAMRPLLAEVSQQSEADFQLLDWRSESASSDFLNHNSENPVNTSHLPGLIIIEEHEGLGACLEFANDIDISNCEFINVLELNTAIAKLRISRLLCSARRQSEQVTQVDQTEAVLHEVMKRSNDWLVVKSLNNRFLHVSGKFCRAYKKTRQQIIGKDDLELGTPPELVFGKPGADWKGYWALDKEVTDSGVPYSSPPLLLDEELNMYESMDKVPLRDKSGEVFALVVCVYRFVQSSSESTDSGDSLNEDEQSTHLWYRKQNLPDNPALFDTNQQRKKAEELKYQTERAFIAKNRFIATASHDLRQPLHALGLFVGALNAHVDNEGKLLVKKIDICVSALNDLLTSLLDISKLDANVIAAEMTDFSVGDLLESLRTECLSTAANKSLDLVCEVDKSFVYSDKVLLRRIVRNLIVNSINYSVQGTITLKAKRLGNHVEVVVADTGIGIPEDQQSLVLEEFVKLDSSPSEAQQGLGLGLSIVKRLCVILNISFWLDSAVGIGTTIHLTIPLGSKLTGNKKPVAIENAPRVKTLDKSDATGAEGRQKVVLVIDDEMKVCEAMEAILAHAGFEVVLATSLESAMVMLQNSMAIPDALLVDFRLSDAITGLDAINIISTELGAAIPALLVTGDTTDDGLKEIINSGCLYLHKPVGAVELLERVHDIVD